jgi:hypothetical protein
MRALTWKQNEFIERMAQSPEHAQWGFELLLKRENFSAFFDGLRERGLFNSGNNPGPIQLENGKYVRIPYWPALDYLLGCAKVSHDANDEDLARKVMDVVRNVTEARRADQGEPDNYHTHRVFAEILGSVPLAVIEWTDIDLIPTWLDTRFDHGGVGHELDKGLMRRLLDSNFPENWRKASRVAYHCTGFVWVAEDSAGKARKKAVPLVDDYWLREFIRHHAAPLGERVGEQAAGSFLSRVRELYSEDMHARASYLFRPAIEEHDQNYDWGGADNRLVEALRDCLIAWVDSGANAASTYIEKLLNDEIEIVRRIAIHLINVRWSVLHELYGKHVGVELFAQGHLHELYGLLRDRFALFTPEFRTATIGALRNLPMSANWSNPARVLKLVQRNWLTAIANKGFEPADEWLAALVADTEVGAPDEHPDFLSYRESWSGPGPTPIHPDELVELAQQGVLVERLNDFEPRDTWRGPTIRALVGALEEAVSVNPDAFLVRLPDFLQARRPYQYGVISGFKRLWDLSKGKKPESMWDQTWPALISMFENLLTNGQFWAEAVIEDADLSPTRNWIPPLISEFLRAGTRDDEHAYNVELLPRTWPLIQTLLERSEAEAEPRDDAMTQAINSPKGKAIEALFSHALRVCRLADASHARNHVQQWNEMESVFAHELAMCRDANFEFSTLAAAYLANIEYLDSGWLQARFGDVFPSGYLKNLSCALSGLAYAPATRSIYRLLVDTGALDSLMQTGSPRDNGRERLMERIALAYLWGDEALDSARFCLIFDIDRVEDLQTIASFLWSISNQDVAPEQVQRILSFWRRSIEWLRTLAKVPASFASSLSRLSVYLNNPDDEQLSWLEYIAPYVSEDHNGSEFVEQLLRLAPSAPQQISHVFRKVLAVYKPTLDYQDRLKTLIRTIASHGLKADALEYASHLIHMPGMYELYEEISARA